MTSSLDDSDEEFDQLNVGPDNELEKVHHSLHPLAKACIHCSGCGSDNVADMYTTLCVCLCVICLRD